VTADIDICYARDRANLERLASALAPLDIRLRGVGDDVPFTLDVRTLRAGDTFTLTSVAGDVDLIASPAGSGGFVALESRADILELESLQVHVASLADLIDMKRAAGRPKDLIEIEILEAIQDEIERMRD
jgi:hypothetical protein